MRKETKFIILVMSIISLIAIGAAYLYYEGINKAEDPRVIQAKLLTKKYDEYVNKNKINDALFLLDSIESIYDKCPHYRNSYEKGVVYNNRASIFLSLIIYGDSTEYFNIKGTEIHTDSLLKEADNEIRKSISIYENWLEKYKELTPEEIKSVISADFNKNVAEFEINANEYLNKRLDEIKLAQLETPRRLSVSYSNLGIVYRLYNNYDQAIAQYKKAIEYWPENLSAKNNINVLLGLPLEERSFLRKLFPKNKKEKN